MQEKQPAATKDDWERALTALDFPIARDALLRHARMHGGIDTEVISMIEALRRDENDSLADVTAEIRDIYVQHGYSASSLPL